MLHYSPIRRVVDRLQKGQIIAEIITNFSLSSIIWRVKGLTDYRSGRGRREDGQEGREERRKGRSEEGKEEKRGNERRREERGKEKVVDI